MYLYDFLQQIIFNLVLVALIVYVSLACYESLRKPYEKPFEFTDNVIGFSMIWIMECIFIIEYYTCLKGDISNETKIKVSVFTLILFLSTILGIVDFLRKRQIGFTPVGPIVVFTTIFEFICTLFNIPGSLVFYVELIVYTITFIVFLILTYRKNTAIARVGVYYITFAVLSMLLINSGYFSIQKRFFLVLNFSLVILMITGMFLYYYDMLNYTLKFNKKKIRFKNTQLIEAENKIENLAYINQETQLKNEYKLKEDLLHKNINIAYMINFAEFNAFLNLFGHEQGIKKLINIINIIKVSINEEDEIYQISNSKFIVISKCGYLETQNMVYNLLKKFNRSEFFMLNLNPHIGITYPINENVDYDILINQLQLASEAAKTNSSSYEFYTIEMYNDFQSQLTLQTRLQAATINNNWSMYFQPKLSLQENTIVGAEALIRWKTEESTITPDVFIPLAEKLGLINEIGEFVIETTFRHISNLYTYGFHNINIAINLSPYQLMEGKLAKFIRDVKDKYNVNPRNVTFEVTETAFMNNIERVNETIMDLKRLGFRFSLDDFGTGYSSLHYISKLNIDEIKFDKNFTGSIMNESKNKIILEEVTRMSKKLGLDVVSEGIESVEQLETVRAIGCTFYQGYYYSKPVCFEEFLALLEKDYNKKQEVK
ncbi:putative bifunctional diguanylate cyclase/phosphodiesterase [Inconstantimicrobium mannanitabidum]|uniref:Uncharacterized protein n=1 Tax=Inconstantimicrobium mannanitabidum TaxID=1604901 RepID=A0ACB5RHE6_9CLOT|nr:GGDEF domain-containing phosphodiesterase [Clostridium sp. TW13]GKX68482.1 hypothetical protein rsdtw13_37400 [Clostridium sp. TW13]